MFSERILSRYDTFPFTAASGSRVCGRQGDVTAQGRINSIHIKRKAFNKESSASSLPGGGKQISIPQIYF